MISRALALTVLASMAVPYVGYAYADTNGVSRDGVWTTLDAMPPTTAKDINWIQPQGGHRVLLDVNTLQRTLAPAPMELTPEAREAPVTVWLPKPDGSFERFAVWQSPILEKGLADLMPEVKTYAGQGIDDAAATVRLSWTSSGFEAQVRSPQGCYWIDRYFRDDVNLYTSYRKSDLTNIHAGFVCAASGEPIAAGAGDGDTSVGGGSRATLTRKEYRLALACTGEYAAVFYSAADSTAVKQQKAMNAMIAAMNRVNGVYETELAVHMNIVANDMNIVYVNSSTDPYTNSNGSTMLGQNQTTCDGQIGSANYDIGHVFSTGGGGVAYLGVICVAGSKAGGVTGLPSPIGDAFYIDYVAHEMGHEFGANHSFGGINGSCSGNGVTAHAFEPGSGSSIMAYAGICGTDDLQAHSDPYFGHDNIDEIRKYIDTSSGNTCATLVGTTNTRPTVSGGSNYTIPYSTPFALTASGSDIDGNTLTYSWEEHDGKLQALPTTDPGSGGILRPWTPTTSPTRYFPRMDVIRGVTAAAKGEVLPSTARTVNFRVTARDNVAGFGGVTNTTANTAITVNKGAGAAPFTVSSQNTTGISYLGGTSVPVTWVVGNTNVAPISCATVNILLSTDNGATWGTTLASGVPNSGSANVTMPNIATSNARLMVQSVGNIFFNVNSQKFSITQAPPATPTSPQASPASICVGGTTALSATNPGGDVLDWYTGSCGGTLVGTGNPLNVAPTANTTYYARARRTSDNAVSAGCASVSVTVNSNPTDPTSASTDTDNFCSTLGGYINLSVVGGSGDTLRWMSDSCGGTTVASGNPAAVAAPTQTTTYYARWETTCGVSNCVSVTVHVTPTADFNGDLFVDIYDFSDFVTCFETNDCPAGKSADFNGDGFVDFYDFTDYVTAFEAGC